MPFRILRWLGSCALLVALAAAPAGAADAPAPVPITIANGHVFVDVKLDGKGPFTFVFDSGAGNSVSVAVAKALGLRTGATFKIGGTGEGSETASSATVATLDVGNAHLTNQKFVVANLDALRASDGVPRFDGLIGREVLMQYVVTLDYAAQTLAFVSPAAYHPSADATAIPIQYYGGTPKIEASIDGITGEFTVDTGERGSLALMTPFVAKHGLRARYKPSVSALVGWGFGGPVHADVTRIGSFRFAGFSIDDVVTWFPTVQSGFFTSNRLAGNIGAGILDRFTVTFDYPQSRIDLIPNTDYADRDTYDRSGLWLTQSGTGFDVADVVANSPAAKAAIAVGDTVVAIDGEDARSLLLADVRRSLQDGADRDVTLTLERNGRSRTVTLALTNLV